MRNFLMELWPGSGSFEDVSTWGIAPLKELNEILGELIDEKYHNATDHRLLFINCEFESKLENVETVMDRYFFYIKELENRLKELVPDDPLVKNPIEIVKPVVERYEENLKRLKRQMEKESEAVDE